MNIASRTIVLLLALTTQLCAAKESLRLGGPQQQHRELKPLSVVVGVMATPSTPLQKCEGDCDSDNECAESLVCMQRNGNEPVPGCTGLTQARYSIDFCYSPLDPFINEESFDTDSTGGTFQETGTQVTETGTTTTTGDGTFQEKGTQVTETDTTTTVGDMPLKVVVGIYGSHTGKLQRCEGSCKTDNDCANGLECMFRVRNEPVSGCTGLTASKAKLNFCIPGSKSGSNNNNNNNGNSGTDYWTDNGNQDDTTKDDTLTNEFLPSLEVIYGVGSTNKRMLQVCEGDCDGDHECAGRLRCMQRDANEDVPGCTGATISRDGIDFCYNPNISQDDSDPEFVEVGTASPVAAPRAASPTAAPTPIPAFRGSNILNDFADEDKPELYPLGRCQGDCDKDSDCESGLVCYQRTTDSHLVPGCLGDTSSVTDYCIDPADNPSNINSDTWRLKLFWREGYFWQEERRERAWCMQCTNGSCDKGDRIKISKCDGGSTDFRFFNRDGETAQIQIAKTNLCLEVEKNDRDLRIARCEDGKLGQKFSSGEGSFGGDRFELQPMAIPGCMTQVSKKL